MMKQINPQLSIIKQKGAAVLLVSIVLLIGVTLITIFAARVGVMDQRISANEYRHKEAQASAHAALDQAGAFVDHNSVIYGSTSASWSSCTTSTALQETFPCKVRTVEYDKVYGVVSGTTISPLAYMASLPNDALSEAYVVYLSTTTGNLMTVVGTGESVDGSGEAMARYSLSEITQLIPGQVPPLMTPVINLGGNFTIVPDPNGAGDGVPVSAWASTFDGSGGSWQTCHHGDYRLKVGGSYTEPCIEILTPSDSWAACDCVTKLSESGDINYDILDADDGEFPPSPFGYLFTGLTIDEVKEIEIKDDATGVKVIATTLEDCSAITSVDTSVNPVVVVTGNCNPPSNTIIGSQTAPYILVVEGELKLNANTEFYGIAVGLDKVSLNGTTSIHGSLLAEDPTKLTTGGYRQIYDSFVLDDLGDSLSNLGLAKISYSSIDF